MVVDDNGIGLPDGFDPVKCKTMGLRLADGLARQLGGSLKFASGKFASSNFASGSGCQVQADFTRMAGQLKSESHGIGQRMVGAKHPLLPVQQQAL
jgi:hypothetical protein